MSAQSLLSVFFVLKILIKNLFEVSLVTMYLYSF